MGISSFSVGLGIGRLPFFFNNLALVPLRVVAILRVGGRCLSIFGCHLLRFQ